MEKDKNKISKILLKAETACLNNIIVFDKLSNTDKEFYILWKEYAPKNQTFTEFKKMVNGDLDKMKSMAKDWVSRSEKIKKCKDLNEQIEDAQHKINDLLNKYGINSLDSLWENNAQFNDLRMKYRDLGKAYGLWNELNLERNRIIGASNYSTINVDFCKYDKVIDNFNDSMKKKAKHEYEQEKKEHPNCWPEHFIRTKKWATLQKNYISELKQLQSNCYDLKIAEKFYLENMGNVAEEYASNFDFIIKNNSEIKQNIKIWKKLDLEGRVSLMQNIVDAYAKTFGTPFVKVRVDPMIGGSDAHVSRDINIGYDYDGMRIQTEAKSVISLSIKHVLRSDNIAVAIDAVAHEYGHIVDIIIPNEGAVGEQFMRNSVYRRNAQTYRIDFTEQSSYKIGPAVTRKITGVKDRYHGKEFDLDFAKKTYKKPDFVKKFWSLFYKYQHID